MVLSLLFCIWFFLYRKPVLINDNPISQNKNTTEAIPEPKIYLEYKTQIQMYLPMLTFNLCLYLLHFKVD